MLAPPLKGMLFSCSPEHVEGPAERQFQQEAALILFERIWAKYVTSSDVDSELRENWPKKEIRTLA